MKIVNLQIDKKLLRFDLLSFGSGALVEQSGLVILQIEFCSGLFIWADVVFLRWLYWQYKCHLTTHRADVCQESGCNEPVDYAGHCTKHGPF